MAIGFTDRNGLMPETQIDRLKPVTLTLELVKPTAAALLVRDGAGAEVWLPRKHISIDDGIRTVRVTLPTWLAIEKGLRTDDASTNQKTLF